MNKELRNRIRESVVMRDDNLAIAKLRWHGHVSRLSCMSITCPQRIVKGAGRKE